MIMETKHTPNAGQELSSAEASSEQSKEDREKTFSRRALLQWSLPLAAAGVTALLPLTAHGQHGDSYTDTPYDDGGPYDDVPHDDVLHDDVQRQRRQPRG